MVDKSSKNDYPTEKTVECWELIDLYLYMYEMILINIITEHDTKDVAVTSAW